MLYGWVMSTMRMGLLVCGGRSAPPRGVLGMTGRRATPGCWRAGSAHEAQAPDRVDHGAEAPLLGRLQEVEREHEVLLDAADGLEERPTRRGVRPVEVVAEEERGVGVPALLDRLVPVAGLEDG